MSRTYRNTCDGRDISRGEQKRRKERKIKKAVKRTKRAKEKRSFFGDEVDAY